MAFNPSQIELNLNEIEATALTQVRRALDKKYIEELALAMKGGAVFPSLVVFAEEGSERFLLADGFHRLAAAKLVGYESFTCSLHRGGVREALQYALSANNDHGLRRNDRDKRNAVELALKDPEWTEWNATEIARLCKVSPKFVRKVRNDLVIKGVINEPAELKEKRGGKERSRRPTSGKSDRSDLEKPAKSGTSKKGKNRKGKRTLDDVNRDEVFDAIATIKAVPHDGAEAVRRWKAKDFAHDFDYVRDWMQEAVEACEDDAA